jgi:hypothetical protein
MAATEETDKEKVFERRQRLFQKVKYWALNLSIEVTQREFMQLISKGSEFQKNLYSENTRTLTGGCTRLSHKFMRINHNQ